ncbi:MAG TPA: alpha/beta fold hydrolase [Actinomycetota bacterium]
MSPRVPSIVMVVALASLVAGLASCSGRADEVERFALERSKPVTFESADGVQLAGRLFGPDDATAGVVLAHMQPADQSSWYAFAERMGDAGYLALTFNFRGYCPGGDAGCSQGKQNAAAAWQDVQGAADYLREQGAQRVGLVGASMGGTASLVVAGQQDADIMAVATLSAPAATGGLVVTPEILQQMTAAKLFVAGNGDVTAATDAQMFYTNTLQPKRVEILPSNDHGTDLLTGNQSENTRTLLMSWLQQFLPVSPPSAGAVP